MKKIFIIIYTIVSTYATPCPSGRSGCLVYHGTTTDTTTVEVITTDTSKVNKIISEYADATIDTFMLFPLKMPSYVKEVNND